jgi:hypothetical protein
MGFDPAQRNSIYHDLAGPGLEFAGRDAHDRKFGARFAVRAVGIIFRHEVRQSERDKSFF